MRKLNVDFLILVGMLFLSSQLFIVPICFPFGPGAHWAIFELLGLLGSAMIAGILWSTHDGER
jgi:hypothetical protein